MRKSPTPSLWDRIVHPLARSSQRPDDSEFDSAFLAQLERLRVAALKALGGGLREGHRLGAYKGGQLEFHGHRDYSPGDELRYLDWNSFARLDRPYIKEFAREESGVLHLLIDGTRSMQLGSPSKALFTRRVAALFAHVALASRDAVHVLVFKDAGGSRHFPGRNVKVLTQAYLTFLQSVTADDPDETVMPLADDAPVLRNAVSEFLRRRPQRGGVLIMSDFWLPETEIAESVSRLTQAGFDASALHTLAAEELEPPASGELQVSAVESEDVAELWYGAETQALYALELEKHRAAVEAIFRKRGGNYLFAPSDTSIEKVLIASLRQRRWLI